jgi:hypothetical protein
MRTDRSRPARIATLVALSLLGIGQTATAAETTPVPVPERPSLLHFLVLSNGIIFGPVMLLLAVAIAGVIIYLAWGLRQPSAEAQPDSPITAWRRWAPQERALRWLGGLGLLGPAVGLLGTLLGVMVLGMEVRHSGAQLADGMVFVGISHAASVLFEGIFMACIAVPAYVVFKNRLQRLMLATGIPPHASPTGAVGL